MRYLLSEEDRQRLGLGDDWIEFDPTRLMMTEAEGLEDAGYDTDQFLEDLQGHEVHDRKGNLVLVPVMEGDGSPSVGEDGVPILAPKLRYPFKAIRAGVWIAVRRSGCEVAFDEFDFDVTNLRTQADPPGKDPEPDPASPN